MRNLVLLCGVCGLIFGVMPVVADPVDNPGDALFYNATGPYPFWYLPNGEWIEGSTEEFETYVYSTGDLDFTSASMPFSPTTQTVGPSSAPVEMQLHITDVSGTVDLSSGIYFDWTITAEVWFRAPAASVSASKCRTESFAIEVTGDWAAGAISDGFQIPALTGTGNGVCNGYAAELNAKFQLGNIGDFSKIDINKWVAENEVSGLPLTGS